MVFTSFSILLSRDLKCIYTLVLCKKGWYCSSIRCIFKSLLTDKSLTQHTIFFFWPLHCAVIFTITFLSVVKVIVCIFLPSSIGISDSNEFILFRMSYSGELVATFLLGFPDARLCLGFCSASFFKRASVKICQIVSCFAVYFIHKEICSLFK